MTDEAWSAMLAAEWRGIIERAQAKLRRKREAARLARFRRALERIKARGHETMSDDDKSGQKIRTSFDYPPIPIRNCDWSAVAHDYEPGDAIGHGATEQEAIADLLMQLDDDP
jgi:hypothetical protein